MGYMEVGSTRYFDVREVNDYYFPVRNHLSIYSIYRSKHMENMLLNLMPPRDLTQSL